MTLKTFTIEKIRSWRPCYDPLRYLPENWEGNVLDILEAHNEIPIQDKFWVVLREKLLKRKILRLFFVLCARKEQYLMRDARSINAIEVAEKYANGRATEKQLSIAFDAARDAACAARADYEAARDAGDASAWSAWAAWEASARAAGEISWAAWSFDWVAVDASFWAVQLEMLIKIIKDEERNQNEK